MEIASNVLIPSLPRYVLYSAFGSFYVPAFVMVFVYCRIFVAARSRARRHLKKKHKTVAAELTTTTATARSTTTCTTSFSSSPPGGRSPQQPPTPQQTTMSTLPKIPESNGLPPPPPEIIVIEDQETNSLKDPTEDLPKVSFDTNSLCEPASQQQQVQQQQLQPTRRFSMLRAPKFLRSPFGSTLSLADMGGSEEDISNEDTNKNPKKNKKKNKNKKIPFALQQPDVQEERKPVTTSEAERQRRRVAKAKERRATLILGLIMASFILAWLPFFVLYVLEALCAVCDIGPTGFAVAFWLGYCNSALNPIIYTIFNRDFRRAFRKILFK